MSLILEALRKSEAERRRGQVPDLHAERAPAVKAARATGLAWPWLALALVAAVMLAWLARGAWTPTPDSAASSPADQPAAASDTGIVAGARDPAAAYPRVATVPLSMDPASAPMDRTPPVITQVGTQVPPRAVAGPIASTVETAAPRPRTTPVGAPIPVVNANASDLGDGSAAPRLAGMVAPSAPRVTAIPAPPAGVAAVAVRPAPATVPAGTAGDTGSQMRLSDLSTADRLELPPLKISMHLWDPSPARRFAIIDGARVNEGDRIGDAVVDEITANAVLLAWRGQQLRIPLR